MRAKFLLLPVLLCSAPALAQGPQVPPQLTDPAMADKLARAMQALSKSFLELPVGEVQAAVEGREPTAADKGLTVRDLGRRTDPDFERNLQRQIAEAKPMLDASFKALAASLPAMKEALERAGETLERAGANMPSPTYPKR